MRCEDLQLNLPVYTDDCLARDERALIDKHLAQCPLCRLKLADFQALRNDLRALPRQTIPADLLAATRRQTARAIENKRGNSIFGFSENFSEWLQMRLMPYSVGAVLSLVFGLSLLWVLLSAAYIPNKNIEMARNNSTGKSTVLLSDYQYQNSSSDAELSAASYSASRLAVAGESPSLNPQGALVALTKSIVRGKIKDDEVVVVADVFQNGIAKIAEVVEPSSDRRAVKELEKALKDDPNYAPFVPAVYDRRSDTVRVILKINTVDVQTHNKPK